MCKAIPFQINENSIINLALVKSVEFIIRHEPLKGYWYTIEFIFEDKYRRDFNTNNLKEARLIFNQVLTLMQK